MATLNRQLSLDRELPVVADVLPRFSGMTVYPQAVVFEQKLSFEQYVTVWGALSDLWVMSQEHLPFWIGDILNEVEFRYGETYAQLIEMFPVYRIETLRNYKWVCGRVPPQMRLRVSTQGDAGAGWRPVSYTHCRAVAGIESPAERERYLALAAVNGWSVRELWSFIQAEQSEQGFEGSGEGEWGGDLGETGFAGEAPAVPSDVVAGTLARDEASRQEVLPPQVRLTPGTLDWYLSVIEDKLRDAVAAYGKGQIDRLVVGAQEALDLVVTLRLQV